MIDLKSGVRRAAATLLAAGTIVSCDRRPIDATAALPAVGTQIPEFDLPTIGVTNRVTPGQFRGAPAVVALWSTHCPFQGPAMAAFDSLARTFASRGVHFVLLADDGAGHVLDSTLATASWRSAPTMVGVANGTLTKLFDHSRTAPSDDQYRIEFVLPSFLLVDANGRVVRRAFGAARETFQPPLDSLVALAASPET